MNGLFVLPTTNKTTFGIVDARSVQNADTAEEQGYDAGKKYAADFNAKLLAWADEDFSRMERIDADKRKQHWKNTDQTVSKQ